MQVSFHGVKNAGAYIHKQKEAEAFSVNGGNYIFPKGSYMNVRAELTNENGNDLDEFKNILKAYPNKYNKNSINIGYEWFINPNNGEKMRLYIVNDNILDLNEVTFDVFNKIFLLMKKIASMPLESLKVENSYLRTAEAIDSFSQYFKYKNENSEKVLDIAHQRDNVKEGAKALEKKFANALTEYVMS